MEITDEKKIDIISNILKKVPEEDRECVRNFFIQQLSIMNSHTYQYLNAYNTLEYNKLDKYLKMMLYSTYCAWYCYMNDQEFLADYKELLKFENSQKFIELSKKEPVFKVIFNRLKQQYS